MNRRADWITLRRQLDRVEGQIKALFALPYACRTDYWWSVEYARAQQSRDAIKRALYPVSPNKLPTSIRARRVLKYKRKHKQF